MRIGFFFLQLLALSSAFTTFSPAQNARLTSSLTMFSGDEPTTQKSEAASRPLEEVPEGQSAAVSADSMLETSTLDEKTTVQNFGRAGEVKDVQWVDPAMSANTNPFNMSLWAYGLFGFPLILLANDFLHFIPESAKEGPLGFLL
eukprot:scaffold363_cov56-Cylindrotheca_fusiformis.AAC.16